MWRVMSCLKDGAVGCESQASVWADLSSSLLDMCPPPPPPPCGSLCTYSRWQKLPVPGLVGGCEHHLLCLPSHSCSLALSRLTTPPPTRQAFCNCLWNVSPRGGASGALWEGADSEANVCLLEVCHMWPVSSVPGPVPCPSPLAMLGRTLASPCFPRCPLRT